MLAAEEGKRVGEGAFFFDTFVFTVEVSIGVDGKICRGISRLRRRFNHFDLRLHRLLILLDPILVTISPRRDIRPLRLRLQPVDVLYLLIITYLGTYRCQNLDLKADPVVGNLII